MRSFVIPFSLLLVSALIACSANPTPAPQPTTAPMATPVAPTAALLSSASASSASNSSAASGTVTIVMVPGKNTARFRVREQLANVALPSDAVGTTQEISGTLVGKMDGSIVSSQSKFTVDMRTLKTDQPMRDGFIQRSTLQTDRYPYATFVPTQAPGFSATLPADGNLNFKLIGDMTIRDVTKSVTWDVQGKVVGDEATGLAKTNFTFEYFNMTIPSVARVLSIVDNIQLELDLDLKRAP